MIALHSICRSVPLTIHIKDTNFTQGTSSPCCEIYLGNPNVRAARPRRGGSGRGDNMGGPPMARERGPSAARHKMNGDPNTTEHRGMQCARLLSLWWLLMSAAKPTGAAWRERLWLDRYKTLSFPELLKIVRERKTFFFFGEKEKEIFPGSKGGGGFFPSTCLLYLCDIPRDKSRD